MIGNEPAFPRAASEDRTFGDLPDGNSMIKAQEGISIRDYFAAKALTGLLAQPNEGLDPKNISIFIQAMAEFSYEFADAMLKARELKKE